MPVIEGKLLGQAQCHSPGNDGHFMKRVRLRNQCRHQGMPGFVISGAFFLFVTDDHAFPFRPHQNLVFRRFQVMHPHFVPVVSGCQEGGFIDQISQIRS